MNGDVSPIKNAIFHCHINLLEGNRFPYWKSNHFEQPVLIPSPAWHTFVAVVTWISSSILGIKSSIFSTQSSWGKHLQKIGSLWNFTIFRSRFGEFFLIGGKHRSLSLKKVSKHEIFQRSWSTINNALICRGIARKSLPLNVKKPNNYRSCWTCPLTNSLHATLPNFQTLPCGAHECCRCHSICSWPAHPKAFWHAWKKAWMSCVKWKAAGRW